MPPCSNEKCDILRSTGKGIVLHRDDNNANNWFKHEIKKQTIAAQNYKTQMLLFHVVTGWNSRIERTEKKIKNPIKCLSHKSRRMCEL